MSSAPKLYKVARGTERKKQIEFFYILGVCINNWAYVDRQLFTIYKLASKFDTKQAALIFFKDRQFGVRLQNTDTAIRSAAPKTLIESVWVHLHKAATDLSHTRNIFAHQPAKRIEIKEGRKTNYVWSIHIDPHERILNKNYPGLRGKDELFVDDLKGHATEVDKLTTDLGDLRDQFVGRRRPGSS